MIRRIAAVCLFNASVAIAAAPNDPGTTIVGDREAAVGLFLDAWREEEASGLDAPPMHALEPLAPLDEASAKHAIEVEAEREAVRRARLQSH